MLRSCLLLLLSLAGCVIRDASFTDPGPLAPVVSAPGLQLVKDSLTTFEVALAGVRPADNVVVQIASSNDLHVSSMQPQLLFTPDDYTTAQSVRIQAHQTEDFDFHSEILEIKSAAFEPTLVPVRIIDPDILDADLLDVCPGDAIKLLLLGDPGGPLTVVGAADNVNAAITPSMVVLNTPAETRDIVVSGPEGTTFSFTVPAEPDVISLDVIMLSAAECP